MIYMPTTVGVFISLSIETEYLQNYYNNNNNTFIDKENQYDTNVSVIKIKSSLWYQIIFIIKNA